MLLRRHFLYQAIAAAATPASGPNVVIVQAPPGVPIPERLTRESLQFQRAYTCCPHRAKSSLALLTGKFPHAARAGQPLEARGFREAGYRAMEGDFSAEQIVDFIRQNKQNPFFVFWAPDRGVDALLGVLDRESLATNAILVFTSAMGAGPEGEPSEESMRIPLAIRYPGRLRAGERSDLLISNVDVMPTLMALCGAGVPEGRQGRNLSRLLLTGEGDRPESVWGEGRLGEPGEWRVLVRGFDKAVINREGEVTHLYNLAEDPQEQKNLAAARSLRRTKDELLAIVAEWRRRTLDGRSASGLRRRDAN